VQRAILAGDEETGVCIMAMEKGLDTGPVYARQATPVDRKTAGELTTEIADMGARLMVAVLGRIDAMTPTPQPEEGATYAGKIEKSEARLDFTLSVEAVERQVRAFNPAPGAFFEYRGERVRILAAEVSSEGGPAGTVADGLSIACARGTLRPTLVQRAGRAAMAPGELLRGFSIPAGTLLS
jgi:methionyl-tRNA formyltransferase